MISECIVGIGPSSASVSTAVQSTYRYMYGIATGGLQGPSDTGAVNFTNLWNSGTLDFIDIDKQAGNMKGTYTCDYGV